MLNAQCGQILRDTYKRHNEDGEGPGLMRPSLMVAMAPHGMRHCRLPVQAHGVNFSREPAEPGPNRYATAAAAQRRGRSGAAAA